MSENIISTSHKSSPLKNSTNTTAKTHHRSSATSFHPYGRNPSTSSPLKQINSQLNPPLSNSNPNKNLKLQLQQQQQTITKSPLKSTNTKTNVGVIGDGRPKSKVQAIETTGSNKPKVTTTTTSTTSSSIAPIYSGVFGPFKKVFKIWGDKPVPAVQHGEPQEKMDIESNNENVKNANAKRKKTEVENNNIDNENKENICIELKPQLQLKIAQPEPVQLPLPLLECEEKLPQSDDEDEIADKSMSSPPVAVVIKHEQPLVQKPAQRIVLGEKRVDGYDVLYSFDIYKNWLLHERRSPIRSRYMVHQKEITHKMRSILVDWMVEVGLEYDLTDETVFLAVGTLDRFLGKMNVTKENLQLVGATSLFIAAKYLEIQPPTVGDITFITDETYTKKQVLNMEKVILDVINFELMVPTAIDFIRAMCSMLSLSTPITCLASSLGELSLLDGERFLKYKASLIALSAVGLSKWKFMNQFWTSPSSSPTSPTNYQMDQFCDKNTTTVADIKLCTQDLFHSFYDGGNSAEFLAIHDKYESVKYCCVAQSVLPMRLPWEFISPTTSK